MKYYYGARITRGKTRRKIYFTADDIRIQDCDLLMIRLREGKEEVFRALARGTWQDVFGADVLDGSEVHEEHDIDEATGKDLHG